MMTLPRISLAVCLLAPTLHAQVSFDVVDGILAPAGSTGLVTADMDSDGLIDIATASDTFIYRVYGSGSGSFPIQGIAIANKGEVAALASGLIATDPEDTVLLRTNSPVPPSPSPSIVEHFNAPSLGSPPPSDVYALGTDDPQAVQIALINPDTLPDLVVSTDLSLWVLTQSVTTPGSFNPPAAATPIAGVDHRGLVVADFDGDGDNDIAITVESLGLVQTFLGDSSGAFVLLSTTAVADAPVALAATQLDLDPDLELVVLCEGGAGALEILDRVGTGYVVTQTITGLPTSTRSIAVADLDMNGEVDIAMSSTDAAGLAVLFQSGGSFTLTQDSGVVCDHVVSGDFDDDGDVDLATLDSSTGEISLLLTSLCRFIRGDANGDGVVDISDMVHILNSLFVASPPTTVYAEDAMDANDDGIVDVSDAVFLSAFLFQGGAAPSAPFPACGFDPTQDGLAISCPLYPSCP